MGVLHGHHIGDPVPRQPRGKPLGSERAGKPNARRRVKGVGRCGLPGEGRLRFGGRIAVGRNNWMFCGSDNGGNTAAVLFSFITTRDRHRVKPFEYLPDVLERIAGTPISKLAELLPGRWTACSGRATPEIT